MSRFVGLQVPLIANLTGSYSGDKATAGTSSHATDGPSYRAGPQVAGIDLVAMIVSDSGLANTEPVWWNASPLGCILIGSQPRGGWQVMQRTVQWGQGRITKAFGVLCTMPALYAYFACSIRNRMEVWQSDRWVSPTLHTDQEGSGWRKTETSTISRPTKLLDGSRGGQAFLAEVLRPADREHYGIEQQARMQFLSIVLTAIGNLTDQSADNISRTLKEDFGITAGLSVIFRRLYRTLLVCQLVVLLSAVAVCAHLWVTDLFSSGAPYVIELTSLACWICGATGLLMQGGNPRVRLCDRPLMPHIKTRLDDLRQEAAGLSTELKDVKSSICIVESGTSTDEKFPTVQSAISNDPVVNVRFGSQHGSVFIQDKGDCFMSMNTLHAVCQWDLEFHQPLSWYASIAWCATFLILSIALQIAGFDSSCIGSEVISICILLSTSVLRGSGISGAEEWMIPAWKRRTGSSYGVRLQGALRSR